MKHKNNIWRIPMSNLQFFAGEGGGDGSGEGDTSGAGDGQVSFDDFLKQEGNQDEFDRRVQAAITTAVTDAQEKWKALEDDKLTEAEKLAKMTEKEKTEYQNKKLQRELDEYKRKDTLSDMSKTARKMLSDEEINIPDELLSRLVSTDAQKTKEAVESFTKFFKDTVNAAVKDALKGPAPRIGTGRNGSVTKEQILAIKNSSERQRMIAEHIELFN